MQHEISQRQTHTHHSSTISAALACDFWASRVHASACLPRVCATDVRTVWAPGALPLLLLLLRGLLRLRARRRAQQGQVWARVWEPARVLEPASA